MIKLAVLAALGVVVAVMGYIRLAPHDPARWHEDPTLVARPGTPNYHLIRLVGGDAIAPVYDTTPEALAQTLDGIARADGAELLAGSVESGHMTYVTRTPIMGYPDYTSVKVGPVGEGASFSAFARARFGRSDLGVNRARLERWRAALDAIF
ncbi:DUF1499 domain-containing protein [Rhodobacteraceae bacterium 2376]|uniref:DUF1499 domain-containing protein n=1 Tax=Rhabdonatronobacter sediminivivens TaxID=2743469 RepID=A0A7Z0I0U6_9RHOB|nr:DUF1499 domain-containing protein [Rhabdonatronobacter sediminivivens]NYS25857.1 DUF1499 domain-containing protein [Rhabdonatronobacter sediminivivens]